MSVIRIDKFISSQLNISRTDSKKILKQSRVCINGEIVKKADCTVNTDDDTVTCDGRAIIYKKNIYIMLNKPKGVVSASTDSKDVTVVDILPDELKRSGLFPAGRLDKDTTGFVLITDDGEFAHNILSPTHHVEKTYIADIEKQLNEEDIKKFTDGMMIGDELFRPAKLSFLEINKSSGNYRYEIKITEGRYHQIKRMFASVDKPVIELTRTAIGGLPLDMNLEPSKAKELTLDELELIFCGKI